MVKIIYVDKHGAERETDVAPGLSLMEGAVRNSVAGIDADCGGACACATCHIYLDSVDFQTLAGPTAMETSMLEFSEDVEATSRLACQIVVTPQMEGLTVRVPASQH